MRDKERLMTACRGIDYVVHAAAMKIVPAAEYNPFECIKTNVHGAMNVIESAIEHKVKRVVALSTDKACNPVNLYGATKLCSDKLFVAGNAYVGPQDTRFAVVRYGNVMGSRGSVIPFFQSLAASGEIPITDERMTRFMITLEQGVEIVWHAMYDCLGGEIYVKKIPSMKVTDIAKVIAPKARHKMVGIRPGEKLHEQMISAEDARMTYEYNGYYKIFPQLEFLQERYTQVEVRDGLPAPGTKVDEGFVYSSDTNDEWMSPQALTRWLGSQERSHDTLRQAAHNPG